MLIRRGLEDDEWAIIGELLPPESARGCCLALGNRLYFEGMMCITRTGSQWGHLPDEYGKWNSVFWRYRCWVSTGVFEAMSISSLLYSEYTLSTKPSRLLQNGSF